MYKSQQLSNVSSSGTSSSAGYVNASGVILRGGPDTRYNKLGKLSRYTTVKVTASFNGWYQIEVPSAKLTGYTLAKYVTLTPTVSAGATTTTGVVTGSLRLRSQASTASSSKILLTMPKGATVTIFSTTNGWCYVDYQGTKGYCSSSYLKIG